MPAEVVLVVADSTFLHDATLALQAEGLTVAAFSSSMAALKALEGAQSVEVLVTGVSFPRQQPNGMSLALMTLRRRPAVRVMFLGPADVAPAVAELGRLLIEPVAVSDLVAAVRQAAQSDEASLPSGREELVRGSL